MDHPGHDSPLVLVINRQSLPLLFLKGLDLLDLCPVSGLRLLFISLRFSERILQIRRLQGLG